MLRNAGFIPSTVLFALLVFDLSSIAKAQTAGSTGKNTVTIKDKELSAQKASPVVIQREALRLIDPKSYQVTIQLAAARTVVLVAPIDGLIGTVQIKPGQLVESQTEAVRLDSREQQLLLERAKANYNVAQIDLKRAKLGDDPLATELANAKIRAAKAELSLAELRLDRTIVRVPFNAKVFRVEVSDGQIVKAGQPLLTLADDSRVQVEIPVDRKRVKVGEEIEIDIEDKTILVKIQHLFPLAKRFEPLRELVESAASAVITLDNKDGKYSVGQTVHAPLIPRHFVSELPASCLSNTSFGRRKVQVIRKNVVRDVVVQLLGAVGDDRLYVSGPFAAGDEVIVSLSRELPDGTQVRLGGTSNAAKKQ